MAKKHAPAKLSQPTTLAFDVANAVPENPDGVRPVYSNNAAVFFGPQDVRVIFTEVYLSSAGNKSPSFELRANVSMATSQFKLFAEAVAQTLRMIEKPNGESGSDSRPQ